MIDLALAQLRETGVASLVGEPGIGKTTVWNACVEEFDAAHTWSTTCLEAEQDLGLSVLSDFFAATPPAVIDRLPTPQHRAVDVVLMRVEDASPIDPRLLGTTTLSVLEALAHDGRVLVAIDDTQWCDSTSLAAFRFAARRGIRVGAAFLGARRGDAKSLASEENVVAVPGLEPLAAAQLIRRARVDLRPRAVTRIVELSQGNPFYALELARSTPAGAADVQVPASLSALLRHRFRGLPAECLSALLDIAVRGSIPIGAALGPAIERGIVVTQDGKARFSHPLLADAARDHAVPADLRAAHQRAAEAVDDTVERVLHRARATEPPDEAIAADLDSAAELARQRGAISGARDLADLALVFSSPGNRPLERVIALARYESLLAHDSAAAELAREIIAGAATPEDQLFGRGILIRTSSPSEALHHADAATRIPGLPIDAQLAAAGEYAWLLWASGRTGQALELLDSRLADAPEGTPGWATIVTRRAIIQRRSGTPHDAGSLARAVEMDRAGQLSPPGAFLQTAATLAVFDDRHDDARRLFHEAAEISALRGDGSVALDVDIAHAELRFGRLDAARQSAERIEDGSTHERGRRDLALLAQICAWQGEFETARRLASAARESGTGLSRPGALVAVDLADGVIALLAGDISTAWQRLHAAARTLHDVGSREPSVPGVLPLAIEAAAALGELEDADALCTRLDEETRAVGSRWGAAAVLAAQAHICAARGDTAQAVALFDAAAAAFAGIDLPLPQGRALLASGSALRRTGHRGEAKQRLLAARELFEGTGAISLIADADAELARLGGPGDGNTLTVTERQVAQLAVGGLRNTEIAVKLQISPKTVEHHLGRVYRKLGVRGRADLAGALDPREPIGTH